MRIGILTSGGDCPGINATIRGVCKTAINHYGMEVIGIHSGFQGLLTKDIESFTDKSLSGLLNQGGTMLGTSREKPFKKGGVVSDVDKPALILQNIQEMGLEETERRKLPLNLPQWASTSYRSPKPLIMIFGERIFPLDLTPP